MTVLIQDSFNRADTTSGLGTADTGQTWTNISGTTWGISSNQAYTSTALDNGIAGFSINETSIRIKVDYPITPGLQSAGIAFRALNGGNFFRLTLLGGLNLQKSISYGGFTSVASSSFSASYPCTISLEVTGDVIKGYYNGELKFTVTDSTLNTVKNHGLYIHNSTAPRLDNFVVETLTTNTDGSSTLQAVSTLTANGQATANGSAALQSVSTLTAAGNASASGSATLQSVITLTATGNATGTINGSSTLQLVSTLTASGTYTEEQTIMSTITLQAERILYVNLSASRELEITLQADRELNVTLQGALMTREKQDFSMFAGETKIINFPMTDRTDLTGANIQWVLRRNNVTGDIVVTKNTPTITIEGTKFIVKLNPADTSALIGKFYHEAVMTDSSGNVSKVETGTITIKK